MIYYRKRKNFLHQLKNLLIKTWKYGLLLLWQKLLMLLKLNTTERQLVNQSLIKTFWLRMIVLWLRWLSKLGRLTKREQRLLRVSPSIRTEAGFMLKYTKCDPTKEER